MDRKPLPLALLALALALPAGTAAGAPEEPNIVYEFESVLAPVCLDGSYPLRLELEGGYLDGTLEVTTDVRGRLSGTYLAGPDTLAVSGKVRHRDTGSTLRMTASGEAGRVTFKGDLVPGMSTGTTSGRGVLAPGKNTFALDLTAAGPTTADVAVVFAPSAAPKIAGSGSVQVCGDPFGVSAKRVTAKSFRLSLKGDGFRWNGAAPGAGVVAPEDLSWKAKGFGAKAVGAGMALPLTPPPSGLAYADPNPLYEAEEPAAPNLPLVSGGPVQAWEVRPSLPAGLTLDPATGVLSGVPAEPLGATAFTITASNLAGSDAAGVTVTIRGNRAYSFAAEQRALTDADYRHLLMRTHFGVRKAELDALKAAGLPAYVDDMLDFRSGTAIEAAAFPELVNGTDPPGLQGGFPSGTQISRWWTRIMLDTDRPFQEVMAFFWHDHMPVAYDVLGGGYTHFEVDYINLLRHRGAGNFRDLLLSVARDPGMLIYLDGYRNTRTAPNENFAREFWELFTLGVDNGYTQADIVQASRAFTGWRFRYNASTGQYYMQFDPNLHDTGPKTFFGQTIPGQNVTDDFAAVVDITLAHRPVAEFITKKIFEYFCYVDPPQALVDEMAAALRASDWELQPFLRSLFLSEAFLSNRSRQGRSRSPLEFGVGLERSTGLKTTYAVLDSSMNLLGQRPGLPPTVDGWPTGSLWFSAAAMVNRTNLAYTIVGDTTRQRNAGIEIAAILPPVPERTAAAVLDTLENLMRVTLTDGERASLIDYLNTVRQSNGTVVPSPFDGSNQTHLDERVRGLVYILAQHPTFHVK